MMNKDKSNETKEFLNSIFSISDINSKAVHLRSNTKTLGLFDDLCYNVDGLLYIIFERFFILSHKNVRVRLSLIIRCCTFLDVDFIRSKMTITELKQIPSFYLYGPDSMEDYVNTNYEQLIKCILDLDLANTQSGEYVPFKLPCEIKAQVYKDRDGFGNEWAGRGSYIINKQYGAKSERFAIIGVRVE